MFAFYGTENLSKFEIVSYVLNNSTLKLYNLFNLYFIGML